MAKKQNNVASNEPWREGRPSFKAYYPEIFLLTLVTIAFIALAVRLSCSTIHRSEDKNKAASVEIVFMTPLYAQDASLDELVLDDEEAPVADAAPEEPVADAEEAAPAADVAASVAQTPEAAPAASQPVASKPATSTDKPATEKPAKKSPWKKVLWIWIICLIVPFILWCWRGFHWIVSVWGVSYELRVDPDNPRATTFLIHRGILNKKTDSLHIGSIKDIQSNQSFLQKYFMGGVGTITLFTNDHSDPEVHMKNMPEPSRIFNSLDSLRRNYWARGGMQLHAGVSDGDADGAFNEN